MAAGRVGEMECDTSMGLRFRADYKGEVNECVYVYIAYRGKDVSVTVRSMKLLSWGKFTSRINQMKFVTYGANSGEDRK